GGVAAKAREADSLGNPESPSGLLERAPQMAVADDHQSRAGALALFSLHEIRHRLEQQLVILHLAEAPDDSDQRFAVERSELVTQASGRGRDLLRLDAERN